MNAMTEYSNYDLLQCSCLFEQVNKHNPSSTSGALDYAFTQQNPTFSMDRSATVNHDHS